MTVYTTILMDPPWNERGGGRIKRGADRHYPLLKTREMPAVIYGSGVFNPAPNAHLYMWATNTFLPDALWLMECLGFAYKTNVCWVKDKVGLGQYFRGRHELLLFGIRGKGYDARTDNKRITSVIEAPRTKHSAKPIEAYHLIEARSHGPYLEMFAREPRTGWDSWGK
jgi:N6-adenosine-specific RNA methylase IME4